MRWINKLAGKKEGLHLKWWHRFLKVAFLFSLVITFLISFAISFTTISPTKNNTTIINNLRDYTASNSFSTDNTIPAFLEMSGDLGCYDPTTNNISYVGEYYLEKSYCNYDFITNADKVVDFFNKQFPEKNFTKEGLFNKILNKDTEKRYCLIDKDASCKSDKIVKYNKTTMFYIEAIFYSLLAVIIWGFFWSLFYHRVFLYILYGNKRKV